MLEWHLLHLQGYLRSEKSVAFISFRSPRKEKSETSKNKTKEGQPEC